MILRRNGRKEGVLEINLKADGIRTLGANLDAEWWGFSGIVRYDANEWFSLNLRGQYFDDEDGFRSAMTQKITANTFSPEV
ncbi:MAG: outer membrane beta-barrel protein [Nitrospinae bacterium]|nr:outer membrane beta-barrel protein [Nitrospinota bacterium]MBL7019954.1 outer membrane beta-barrel protein [Nitrospinaceae bacterium]